MRIKHVVLGICLVVAGYVWGRCSVVNVKFADDTIYINNAGKEVCLPDGFSSATEEDLLVIDTVADGVTYIGFKHLN